MTKVVLPELSSLDIQSDTGEVKSSDSNFKKVNYVHVIEEVEEIQRGEVNITAKDDSVNNESQNKQLTESVEQEKMETNRK
jgi:hypothetical protein